MDNSVYPGDSPELREIHQVFGEIGFNEVLEYVCIFVFEVEEDEVSYRTKLSLNFSGKVGGELIGEREA